MTQYPDIPNPDLLDRIPVGSSSVLDVGCSTGILGAMFKRINPRARVLGIDIDPIAAEIAATRLDEMAIVDVEISPFPFSETNSFDCIVYGDVLEHLREPFETVRRHAELLSDDGTILICVPNVEHWSFAARLLQGGWDYEPEGLLDETHLRWFTAKSMLRGLEAVRLTPCDVHPRIFRPEIVDQFIATITPGLEAIGVDPGEYRIRAAPLQYVWRVRKQPRRLMSIAATMLRPIGGVSHTRILHPLSAMSTYPTIAGELLNANEPRRVGVDSAKVMLLHRPMLSGPEALATIRTLVAEGWIIVTEFDDHPDHFEGMRGDDVYSFRGVHAVQTSTEPLAEVLRQRNAEVMVFPNAIHTLPEIHNFRDPGAITLFFGALNREQDWEPLMPALNAAAAIARERLRFCIVHDRAMFERLESPYKKFTPTCDYDTYLSLLGQSEVSLMPLGDTPFNRAKSDLKFIEAGACRVAALASPVVYGSTIIDGQTGIIFRDPAELRVQLLRLVMMPDVAREIGDRARAYVAAERMLAYRTTERIRWYDSLWDRRDELTQALLERMPELAEFRDQRRLTAEASNEAAREKGTAC